MTERFPSFIGRRLVAAFLSIELALTAGLPVPSIAAAGPQALMLDRLGIPARWGFVTEASEHLRTPLPDFILIQDLHAHEQAQRLIARILQRGMRRWRMREVFVEGAFGPVDVSLLRRLPQPARQSEADRLVREGYVSGPELAAMEAPARFLEGEDLSPLKLTGIESPEVYWQNARAWRQAKALESRSQAALAPVRGWQGQSVGGDRHPIQDQLARVSRLLRLELSPEDYDSYVRGRQWNPRSPTLNPAIAAAEDYYRLARQRDTILLENTLRLRGGQAPAVLVVGGFHAAGITRQLRRRGASYVVLSPAITGLGQEQVYRRRMGEMTASDAETLAVFKFLDSGARLWNYPSLRRFRVRQLRALPRLKRQAQKRYVDYLRDEFSVMHRPWDWIQAHRPSGFQEWFWRIVWTGGIYAALASGLPIVERLVLQQWPGGAWVVVQALAMTVSYAASRWNESPRNSASRHAGLRWVALPAAAMLLVGHAVSLGLADLLGVSSMRLPGPPRPERVPSAEDLFHPDARNLIFTNHPQAVRSMLVQEAENSGRPYVVIDLRDPNSVERLRHEVMIENGRSRTVPGPVDRIVTGGGLLIINYEGAHPKAVATLNSLSDSEPALGLLLASGHPSIAGIVPEKEFRRFSGAFYRRYKNKFTWNPAWEDPLERLEAPPEGAPTAAVHLYGSHDPTYLREVLIGRTRPEAGGFRPVEGALARAARAGHPLTLIGGDWSDPALPELLRPLLETGIVIDGKRRPLPPIYRQPAAEEHGSLGTLLLQAPGESTAPGDVWIVNEATYHLLFRQTRIRPDGHLEEFPGVLGSPATTPAIAPFPARSAVKLRITGPLPDDIWRRLIEEYEVSALEVAPGVPIPSFYRAYRTERLQNAAGTAPATWEQAMQGPSALIIGEDRGAILARLRRSFPGKTLYSRSMTPTTRMGHLFSSSEKKTGAAPGEFLFELQGKEILEKLEQGEIVVLDGLEHNEMLRRQLETVLCEDPYLIVNDERRPLLGKIFLVSRPTTEAAPPGVVVRLPADDVKPLLKAELGGLFNEADYNHLRTIERALQRLPPPQTREHPERFEISYERMKLLFKLHHTMGHWLPVLELMVFPLFAGNPDMAAFARVLARVEFGEEEEGRIPRSIHQKRLTRALNKVKPFVERAHHAWEFADALSLDLLKELFPSGQDNGIDYSLPPIRPLFPLIERAMVRQVLGHREREVHLRDRFRLGDADVADAPEIDGKTRAREWSWDEQKRLARRALETARGVFFKGPPGMGKSHMANELADELRYDRRTEVIGPLTAGADPKITFEAEIAAWARLPKGGLLIVDEANLAHPAFWNMLRGVFGDDPHVWIAGRRVPLTERHRIIFTGNNETVLGRRWLELVQDHMPILYFDMLDDEFLHKQTLAALDSPKRDHPALARLIMDLHRLFRRVAPEAAFSLRDLQEVCARINVLAPSDWRDEDIVRIAWRVYEGNFSPEDRQALEFHLLQRYGVELRPEGGDAAVRRLMARQAEFLDGKRKVVLVESMARVAADIEDLLTMRRARLADATTLQGKRGMFMTGPSGHDKDDLLLKMLELSKDLYDARKAPPGTPGHKLYYIVNARLGTEELERVIDLAQQQGSIVIVQEMDVLPTEYLEGHLNDALTRDAHPGFLFSASMNSMAFSGRNPRSTALNSRIIDKTREPYRGSELKIIVEKLIDAEKGRGALSTADRDLLVQTHLWVRDQIEDVSLRPTPPDLLEAARLVAAGAAVDDALREVYGPVFLDRALAGRELPSAAERLAYVEPARVNNLRYLERIAQIATGSVRRVLIKFFSLSQEAKEKGQGAAAFWSWDHPSISLFDQSFRDGEAEDSLLHESGHGRFDRVLPWLAAVAGGAIWDDLSDLRQLNAFAAAWPHSKMGNPSAEEIDVIQILRSQDLAELTDRLTATGRRHVSLQKIFQYSLLAFARGLVEISDVAGMAEKFEGLMKWNPFALALSPVEGTEFAGLTPLALAREIASAFTTDEDDEEETLFQQDRAQRRMGAIQPFFEDLPDGEEDPEPVPAQAQEDSVRAAVDDLNHRDLSPRAAEEPPAVPPRAQRPRLRSVDRKRIKTKLRKVEVHLEKKAEKELQTISGDLRSKGGVTTERLHEILSTLMLHDENSSVTRLLKHPRSWLLKMRIGFLLRRARRMENARQAPSGAAPHQLRFEVNSPIFWIPATIAGLGALLFLFWTFHPVIATGMVIVLIWLLMKGPRIGGLHLRVPAWFERWLSWLETADAAAHPEEPVPPRRSGAAAHSGRGAAGIHAITVSEPLVEREVLRPIWTPPATRDERLAEMTGRELMNLDQALKEFLFPDLRPGLLYGPDGSLDIDQLLLSGDIHQSHRQPGGESSDKRLELVLVGAQAGQFDDVLREFFFFLFERGFRVTVYTTAASFTETRSVEQLEAALKKSGPAILDRKPVEADLRKRLPRGGYEEIQLPALRARIESFYLYESARQALGSPAAPPVPALSWEFERERSEQMAGFGRDHPSFFTGAVPFGSLFWAELRGDHNDIAQWPTLNRLGFLHFGREAGKVSSLEPLLRQPRLDSVTLPSDWQHREEEIRDFIARHQNRDFIKVFINVGPGPSLKFDAKSLGIDTVMSHGDQGRWADRHLPTAKRFDFGPGEIDLEELPATLSNEDLHGWPVLADLRELNLSGTGITDLSLLLRHPNLKKVVLPGDWSGHEKEIQAFAIASYAQIHVLIDGELRTIHRPHDASVSTGDDLVRQREGIQKFFDDHPLLSGKMEEADGKLGLTLESSQRVDLTPLQDFSAIDGVTVKMPWVTKAKDLAGLELVRKLDAKATGLRTLHGFGRWPQLRDLGVPASIPAAVVWILVASHRNRVTLKVTQENPSHLYTLVLLPISAPGASKWDLFEDQAALARSILTHYGDGSDTVVIDSQKKEIHFLADQKAVGLSSLRKPWGALEKAMTKMISYRLYGPDAAATLARFSSLSAKRHSVPHALDLKRELADLKLTGTVYQVKPDGKGIEGRAVEEFLTGAPAPSAATVDQQMEGIRKFFASNQALADCKVENMTDLGLKVTLKLSQPIDLSGLRLFPAIFYAVIHMPSLTDIRKLDGLEKVRLLNIEDTGVARLTDLTKWKNLETLYISNRVPADERSKLIWEHPRRVTLDIVQEARGYNFPSLSVSEPAKRWRFKDQADLALALLSRDGMSNDRVVIDRQAQTIHFLMDTEANVGLSHLASTWASYEKTMTHMKGYYFYGPDAEQNLAQFPPSRLDRQAFSDRMDPSKVLAALAMEGDVYRAMSPTRNLESQPMSAFKPAAQKPAARLNFEEKAALGRQFLRRHGGPQDLLVIDKPTGHIHFYLSAENAFEAENLKAHLGKLAPLGSAGAYYLFGAESKTMPQHFMAGASIVLAGPGIAWQQLYDATVAQQFPANIRVFNVLGEEGSLEEFPLTIRVAPTYKEQLSQAEQFLQSHGIAVTPQTLPRDDRHQRFGLDLSGVAGPIDLKNLSRLTQLAHLKLPSRQDSMAALEALPHLTLLATLDRWPPFPADMQNKFPALRDLILQRFYGQTILRDMEKLKLTHPRIRLLDSIPGTGFGVDMQAEEFDAAVAVPSPPAGAAAAIGLNFDKRVQESRQFLRRHGWPQDLLVIEEATSRVHFYFQIDDQIELAHFGSYREELIKLWNHPYTTINLCGALAQQAATQLSVPVVFVHQNTKTRNQIEAEFDGMSARQPRIVNTMDEAASIQYLYDDGYVLMSYLDQIVEASNILHGFGIPVNDQTLPCDEVNRRFGLDLSSLPGPVDLGPLSRLTQLSHLKLPATQNSAKELGGLPHLNLLVFGASTPALFIDLPGAFVGLRVVAFEDDYAPSIDSVRAGFSQRFPDVRFESARHPGQKFGVDMAVDEAQPAPSAQGASMPAVAVVVSHEQKMLDRVFARDMALLVNPEKALNDVYRRFAAEGREEDFRQLVGRINPPSAALLPPAMHPLTQALWSWMPGVLRRQPAAKAFFAAVWESLYWFVPLGLMKVGTMFLPAIPPAALLVGLVGASLAVRRWIFLPMHRWWPEEGALADWGAARGIFRVPVTADTRNFAWSPALLYPTAIALFAAFPALAIGIAAAGWWIHARHDYHRFPSVQPHTLSWQA